MERVSRDKFPDCKQVITEIKYKGPYGKRETTLNGYISFSCPDGRDATLKALRKDVSIMFNVSKVNVKLAKTRINLHRDAMFHIAAIRVKEHAAALGKTVEIVKGNARCVKVNGEIVFQQSSRKSNECSKFSGLFVDRLRPD